MGTWPSVSLKKARENATETRYKAKSESDESGRGKAAKGRVRLSHDATVSQLAELYLQTRLQRLSTEKERKRYVSRTNTFTVANWGDIPISDLNLDDLIKHCAPDWHTKHKSLCDKLLDLQGTLDVAHRRGIPVNTRLVQDLKDELGRSRYRAKSLKNDWSKAPKIYAKLPETSDDALVAKIHLLCVTRPAPVCSARWSDMRDANGFLDVWTIPRNHMKGVKIPDEENLPLEEQRKPHCVPMTDELKRLFQVQYDRRFERSEFVFARPRRTKAAYIRVLAAMQAIQRIDPSATNHGWRHAFSTWARDECGASHEAVEMHLDHAFGTEVSQIYNEANRLVNAAHCKNHGNDS